MQSWPRAWWPCSQSLHPSTQGAALARLAAHRMDPGLRLEPWAGSAEPELEVAALRMYLQRVLGSPSAAVRSTALETGLILGAPEAWRACERHLSERLEGWEQAALLWASSGERELTALLQALEVPRLQRAALWALGFSGQSAAGGALVARGALPLRLPAALGGRPWSFEGLLQALAEGPMRRRPALALELAIRTRGRHQLTTDTFTSRRGACGMAAHSARAVPGPNEQGGVGLLR